MNLQNNKEIYIFFGIGIVLILVVVVLFFMKPKQEPVVIPPVEEGIVYEDDRFILTKKTANKYEAELKNIEVTENEIREKAKLTDKDELTILLREDLLPPLDAAESYQEEINKDIEEQKNQQNQEFNSEEWGLNPNHAE